MKRRVYIFRYFFLLLLIALGKQSDAQSADTRFQLIPYPTNLTPGDGHFTISPSTIIVGNNRYFKNESTILSELFINSFGKPLRQGKTPTGMAILLVYDSTINVMQGYHLKVTPQQLVLAAKSPAGMFMGIQTVRQLLPASIESKQGYKQASLTVPAVTIIDEPVYAWRGMHLDVSRHFFSTDYLKKFIDLMALYKFNKFHLHLTDDQGWRIEIKKYPKLTEEGAWRTFNNQDSVCMVESLTNPDFIIDPKHIVRKNGKTMYGGFYTQKEMKEIVAYASAKHIDIIPEIDMPGHMMAATNSYNFLNCDGKSAFGELFSTPICPCLPTTTQFAKDVYTEIMDIFPSKYIHIGGDEVDRSFWEKSEECKALMARENFTTTAEIQSYFIRGMEKFFNEHGRTLVGWDEILEGGMSKTAVITYWRAWLPKTPVQAVKNGNRVIMATLNPLYFSYPPNKNSLSDVYHFNPVPDGLTTTEAEKIIGAQGNVWTEHVPSENRADYLIMPRLTALAEVLWTKQKDYKSYLERLNFHYSRLDLLQVNYRLPDLPILEKYVFIDKTTLELEKPLNNLTIRYTTDSTIPNLNSKELPVPYKIDESQYLRLAAFKPNGTRSDIYNLDYKKVNFSESEKATSINAGLTCSWYKAAFKGTTFIPDDNPDGSANVPNITVPKEAEAPSFALKYRGYINVPEKGIYTFYLLSDDASVLRIANREVVNNDGMHSPLEKNGQVALTKGLHPFALDFVEGGGGYTLRLKYSINGSEPANLPSDWFRN